MAKAPKKERDYISISVGCLDARDIKFKSLPEGVEVCGLCGGNGKWYQYYCDAGRTTGPCGCCKATGFLYTNTGRAVPPSVLNQIAVANSLEYRRYEPFGIDWINPKSSQ